MSQTKERSWSIKQPQQTEVLLEGIYGDIPQMVDDLLDPTSELGEMARKGTIFVLKTRGFSLLALEEEFSKRNKGHIDEFFPVRASFKIENYHYFIERTDRPASYTKGNLIP